MGASIQWRQPPPGRRDRRYGTVVEFGRGPSRGRGYMAASSRVGPSVLVIDEPDDRDGRAHAYADALNEDGFTALAVEPPTGPDESPGAILEAAASFLSENWHPRLGIVAFGSSVPDATRLALETGAEALVGYTGDAPAEWNIGDLPAMVHVWGPVPSVEPADATSSIEVCSHEGLPAEEGTAEALAQTLDFFHYHLS